MKEDLPDAELLRYNGRNQCTCLPACNACVTRAPRFVLQGVLGLGVGRASELGDSVKKAYAQV